MAQLKCICGFMISDSEIPNDIEYRVFSTEDWLENELLIEENEKITPPPIHVWKCPSCKRLHVFNTKENKRIAVYKLEIE